MSGLPKFWCCQVQYLCLWWAKCPWGTVTDHESGNCWPGGMEAFLQSPDPMDVGLPCPCVNTMSGAGLFSDEKQSLTGNLLRQRFISRGFLFRFVLLSWVVTKKKWSDVWRTVWLGTCPFIWSKMVVRSPEGARCLSWRCHSNEETLSLPSWHLLLGWGSSQ